MPAVPSANDPGAVELGVRFRSSVNGFVTGVRFYKGAANTGTHVGNLWTSAGALLATATFTNESATGWQTVTFSSPVAVTANTVYVASYFAPNGGYAVDPELLRGLGRDERAAVPAARRRVGRQRPVSLRREQRLPGFDTFQASNYWVDVVFTTSGGAPGHHAAHRDSDDAGQFGATAVPDFDDRDRDLQRGAGRRDRQCEHLRTA